MKQKNKAPVEVAHQVCIIYAVTKGYLNDIAVDQIPEFQQRLQEFMENRYETVLTAIRTTGKLEQETEDSLQEALVQLLSEFQKGN